MLDLLIFGLVCVLVGVVFGGVLGWLASAHVHDIAAKTPSPSLVDKAKVAVDDTVSKVESAVK